MFRPKLFDTLKNYNRQQFGKDLMAGLIVGIVALPLAIAFAIASGVSPEKGLYTAVIAGFIIAALGGSRVQIGGPNRSFYCNCLWNCTGTWCKRFDHCHFYGRYHACYYGFCPSGLGYKIYSASFNYWFYQRYCSAYLFFPDKGFFRVGYGCRSCRFFR